MPTPSTTVTIERAGREWRLSCAQRVPRPVTDVFPFFASAHNLERLTPGFLRFSLLRASSEPLAAGSLIDYKLRLHGIPVRWRTRIDDWTPPRRFVDVQLKGPFRRWHHLHEFEPDGSATLVKDTVTFDLYFRTLYRTPALSWIESDLRRIFEYRHAAIASIFRVEQPAKPFGTE